jgi:hypothetical protein
MHICFKIVKFLLQSMLLYMFGHCCVHHQEPSTTAHAASGYRVILCWLRPPALLVDIAVLACVCVRHTQERQYQQNSAGGRNQHKITR